MLGVRGPHKVDVVMNYLKISLLGVKGSSIALALLRKNIILRCVSDKSKMYLFGKLGVRGPSTELELLRTVLKI